MTDFLKQIIYLYESDGYEEAKKYYESIKNDIPDLSRPDRTGLQSLILKLAYLNEDAVLADEMKAVLSYEKKKETEKSINGTSTGRITEVAVGTKYHEDYGPNEFRCLMIENFVYVNKTHTVLICFDHPKEKWSNLDIRTVDGFGEWNKIRQEELKQFNSIPRTEFPQKWSNFTPIYISYKSSEESNTGE